MSKQTSSSAILESVSDAIVDVTERVSRSVVQVGAGRWRGGTGTVWSKDGHIVTSNHVIGEMREVEVGFSDGTKHTAKVVGKDPYSDLALLKVDSDNLTAIEQGNSDGLKVGQFVLAVANPFGRQPSATSGIVTNPAFSTRRWWGGGGLDKVLVTDARLNPGYSGGPIVDARGRMLGINAAYANNRGISVPVNTVKTVVDKLLHDGKIKRAYMGITAETIGLPESLSKQTDIGQSAGLIIYGVDQDSAAKKAGLALGDVVVKLDGKPVETLADLRSVLDDKAIGRHVNISVLRGEKLTTLAITPTEAEQD
ncbi:MAG TPA: trypsin-like peptidase domain-containing protein [Candidatus Angelobacter sp.]|nr:trypsin-like peptidase domain-containing protein [Candidatus Angelobacter sp.]